MATILPPTDIAIEVRLCQWHLRCVFWNERIWERYFSRELDIIWGPITPRIRPTVDIQEAKYNQELYFVNPHDGDRQIARCHWFLGADQVTAVSSGFPDPKEILWRGFDYHLLEKGGRGCEYCALGLTTYPTGEASLI